MIYILKELAILIMLPGMLLKGEKTYYLITPEDKLPKYNKDTVFKGLHLMPSVILAVLLVVKIIPAYSVYYTMELEENSLVIPATILGAFIALLIFIGMIIETVLVKTDPVYADYKETLRENSSN